MRDLLLLLSGRRKPAMAAIVQACGNKACIRPDHQVSEPKGMNMQTRQRKLSDDQVRLIREDPRSIAELARVYVVNPSTIWRIKQRRNKAGVPDVASPAHIATPIKESAG